MLPNLLVLASSLFLGSASLVSALGSSCSSPLGAGTSGADDPFWMESMKHQGASSYNTNGTYQVFRNVKDFGAKGDGTTDDTAAINDAISSGSRCSFNNGNCSSSSLTPAVVYFPQGTYLVSQPLIVYYYTQMIGDAKKPPTIQASADFSGIAVMDIDPYIDGGNGAQWYVNQNNFFRSVRNFVFDLTKQPASATATALHWQAAQSTSLINLVINMSTDPTSAHQGIYMENGSGGFMGDLVFNGGKYGMFVGNQQFTVRNVSISNAQTAIYSLWNWAWTYQGLTISNCGVGLDMMTGGLTKDTQTTGSVAVIDAVVSNTPVFIRSSNASTSLAGAIVINNAKLSNVTTAVGVVGGKSVLDGGSTTIDSWGQGNVYSGTSGTGKFVQDTIPAPNKAAGLLDSAGRIVGKMHPQYAAYATDQFVSAKSEGAKGDGKTDDTSAVQGLFDKYAGCKIIFFDAGTYVVSDTISIPAGTQIVGEAWSVISGSGSKFQSQDSPAVVVQVGKSGDTGVVEISDMLFSTIGPAAGAIVLEWNVAEPDGQQAGAGTWDTHIRLGGTAGTNLELSQCPSGSTNDDCAAAYLGLHLTAKSTAYLEGMWVWTADHDVDGDGYSQISVFTGRGILSESAGPVWMIGTASEHFALYQYNLASAKNHYMGFIQTESPYYQPKPAAPAPFTSNSDLHDPTFSDDVTSAWGLYVQSSSSILIFGAGHYSFYNDYTQDCLNTTNCQSQIVNIDTASTDVTLYGLTTVATENSLSVGGTGVAKGTDNVDGFADTVTAWTQS